EDAADHGRPRSQGPAQVHDHRRHGVLPYLRRGYLGLAGRAHRAAVQRRGVEKFAFLVTDSMPGTVEKGAETRARWSRQVPGRLVRDQGADVRVADQLRPALPAQIPRHRPLTRITARAEAPKDRTMKPPIRIRA